TTSNARPRETAVWYRGRGTRGLRAHGAHDVDSAVQRRQYHIRWSRRDTEYAARDTGSLVLVDQTWISARAIDGDRQSTTASVLGLLPEFDDAHIEGLLATIWMRHPLVAELDDALD